MKVVYLFEVETTLKVHRLMEKIAIPESFSSRRAEIQLMYAF